MNRTKQFLIMTFAFVLQSKAFTQATNNSPANNFYSGGFLGWTNTNGANPLLIKTNNITRMHFNGSTAGYGVITSGFIGIGTSNPAAPLHIIGSGSQNVMGWQRGITLSNAAAIMFDGGGGSGFFMAHPSSTPNGNFYGGIGTNLNATAAVNYAYSISVNSQFGMNPLASVDFYKNVIVYQTTFERKFGVNVLDPARVSEIYDGGSAITDAQLRLSTSGNRWTDFRTTSTGEMLITPEGGKVGITDGGTSISTTATLDINGDTRIRNVQIALPDALFVGEQVTGLNDLNLRRLDFSGLATDVLQGNGTWGPATSPLIANNGITLTAADEIQIGEVYNAAQTVPLLNNREVRMNNKHFVFSRTSTANTGNVGIGLIFPSAPTQRLDVDGNARLRNVPSSAANYIMTGLQVGANPNDIVFTKTAFPMDNTQVLHGDGTWGPVPAGNAGPVGAIGLTGPSGPIGPIGLTGATGPQGVAGAQGATGPQGLTGATGPQGTAGSSTGAHNGTSMSLLDPTKVALGQDLNDPSNPGELLNNREVPMNNNNVVFTDNGSAANLQNNIGIGTSNPDSKLHININSNVNANNTRGLRVENHSNTVQSTGIEVSIDGTNNVTRGLKISIDGSSNPMSSNEGVRADLDGGTTTNSLTGIANNASSNNIGVIGAANSLSTIANTNIGVQADARAASGTNFGILATAYGHPAGITSANYGLYSRAIDRSTVSYGIFSSSLTVSPINYGIFATVTGGSSNFAGYFQGNVHVTGLITTTNGPVLTSDQQFKTNIQPLSNAMDILNDLQPKTFNFDTTNFVDFNFESDQQMGLIAQEVEQVLPTIVSNHIRPAQYDSLGIQTLPELAYKGVEYEELIPLLIAGAQEQNGVIESQDSIISAQQTEIDDLNDRLTQLENCLSGILPFLCQMNNSVIQPTQEVVQEQLRAAIKVNLSDRNSIILNQNVPNPFAESTTITFSIPTSVQKAQIHFYDGQGKLINSVDIVERGNGQLNVFANDLSTGVYTYSLVADGQIVSTKRMVKE